MKKISLDLDAIEVESFPTAEPVREHGTVKGFDVSRPADSQCDNCSEFTCFEPSCMNFSCEPEVC